MVLRTKGQKKASFGLPHRKIAFIDYGNIDLRKSKKICSFPKVLVHGFGQNLESTSFFGFKQNRPKQFVFWGDQNLHWKKSKNFYFPKGLISPWILEKFGNLLIFCFKHNRPKKVVLCPSTLKTSLFRLQKHFCIFPKGLVYGFGEKCEFSLFYVFFSKIGKINMPCNLLHRKLVFLDYENTDLKKWKNLNFPKGAGPWFWSKMWIFFILWL